MSKDYKVGFKKPPVHSQFKPGQSGNPKGRRKGSRNLATDISSELQEKLTVTEGGKQKRITKQRAMIKALIARAVKGDVRATTALFRLIPDSEKAQKAVTAARTTSPIDEDIVQAFREQIVDELQHSKQGGPGDD